MVKIIIAQTHENDRRLLGEFLKASNYEDVELHAITDSSSVVWPCRSLAFWHKPAVIISSQRDLNGHDNVSNLIHLMAMARPIPTLTLVYSRAAAYPANFAGVTLQLMALSNTPLHQVRLIPKVSDDTRPKEHDTILSYIQDFERSIK